MTRMTNPETLACLARKYVWWKSADEAMQRPDRIIAQVMNIGDFEDVVRLEALVGRQAMQHVLEQAEIGQFTPRSWSYWHYRLEMVAIGEVPDLPSRRVG